MFRFVLGRQGTGYYKLKVFQFLFADCYILKYEQGSYILPHKDPVEGRKHFRLNLILSQPTSSKFLCNKTILNLFNGRVILFRPDKEVHEVTLNTGDTTRYVLSFGVAI